MPVNSHTTNSFTNAFMQGFSFVDDINNRRVAQKKLDERLAEEKKDRDFRRTQAEINAQRTETLFKQSQDDRALAQNEKELGRQGDKIALSGNATREDLLPFISYSQAARDTLAKQVGEDQMLADLEEIRKAGAQPPTQTGGLSGQVAAEVPGSIDTASPEIQGDNLLAGSRGRSGFQSVDLDDLQDPDAPKGLGGVIRENFEGANNRITSAARGASVAGANLVNSVTGQPPVESGASFADAAGGNISVPEAYTTEEEFAQISDPAEFEAARKKNEKIVADIKKQGYDGTKQTRLDALKAGDRKMRAAAQREEFITEQRYADYANPDKPSQFRTLAAEDPQAAAIQYFNDRATLQSSNPSAARAMDQELQPVLRQAEAQMQATIGQTPNASPERARALRDLRSMQVTQAQIYSDYSPSQAAGIRDTGLPVGNGALSNTFVESAYDPTRPRPMTPLPGGQVASAGTQVSRLGSGSSRRASESQLRAAIRLVDAGLAGKSDLIALTMTGQWPSTAPAAQLKQFRPGEAVYTMGADGSIKYAFTPPGAKDGKKPAGVNTNQLQQAGLDQILAGAKTVLPGDDEGTRQFLLGLQGAALDDADWIQENFDLTDPVAANRIGRAYAQAMQLSAEEDSGWVPNIVERWLGDAPTMSEIMKSPALAARLAVEHDIPFKLVPEQRFDDAKVNNLRQELQIEGKYRPELFDIASDPNVSDEDLVLSIARYDALTAPSQ